MAARSAAADCSSRIIPNSPLPPGPTFLLSQEGQERVEGVGDPVEGVLADFLFGPVVDPALLLALDGNAEHALVQRIVHDGNRQEPIRKSIRDQALVEGQEVLRLRAGRFSGT